MVRELGAMVVLLCGGLALAGEVGSEIPQPKPVPRMQAVPQPYDQVSFQRDGQEIARYHFGPTLKRPFIFPVIGPAGRSLTRMGHPRDPQTHSHHNSVWITHQSVDGVNFWEDRGKARIAHQRIEAFEDLGDTAWMISLNHWLDESGKVLLIERRRTQIELLDAGQWMLYIDVQLQPPAGTATLGKTAFGPIGVRMAKTIGVNDGGGMIRNSEGAVNEKAIFWKPAKWVDYSGPITSKAIEGITLMDHPANPNFPNAYHVRADGWMGISLTLNGPMMIEVGKPLRLRYGLYIHAGRPELSEIQKRWELFAKTDLLALPRK